jgi:hypothetical protein
VLPHYASELFFCKTLPTPSREERVIDFFLAQNIYGHHEQTIRYVAALSNPIVKSVHFLGKYYGRT